MTEALPPLMNWFENCPTRIQLRQRLLLPKLIVLKFLIPSFIVLMFHVLTFVWIPIVAVLHFLFRTDQFVSFSSYNACRSDVCHFDVCRSDFCRSDACCSDLCRC